MKPYALTLLLLLTLGLVAAEAGYASDAAVKVTQLRQHSSIPAATPGPLQNNLLQQLMAREITYRLDQVSDLKFSCSLAALSGTSLTTVQPDFYPIELADIRVELVVRF